ncbi:PD-(D/E)XK nuclease family protein [Propionimicrobium lymphophilum]|uniref:PD-(D/E)XK nuclease family protein n=1 Tax=Propionimicrobium lymphophilum TaxID=33012 RepID=UPI00254D08D1|nr:PD-(D/E)XK nuclease family protein [Propionimicrobium lymphophilum]MDK7710821.1 PD-(D/E)XK nuclease family protein [Propionimicrobium lymphophilum]MDK7734610.1 PD-(D/E)XK nuclease family protein [Propionimicrobium lymphophilum]
MSDAVFSSSGLVVDEQTASSLVPVKGFSPSSFASICDCPARWAGERVFHGKPNLLSPAQIGSGAHYVLEMFYGLSPDQRSRFMFGDCLDRAALDFSDLYGLKWGRRTDWCMLVEQACQGLWGIEDPMEVDIFAREFGLNGLELGGVPFFGVVDRMRDDNGLYWVEDYKTSYRVPYFVADSRHLDQQRLYILALRSLDYPVAGARLLYTRIGKVYKVPTSRRDMRDILERFKQAWGRLNDFTSTGVFPASPSASCRHCPFSDRCQASAH